MGGDVMDTTVLLQWGEVIWKYGAYIFIFWAATKLLKFLLGFLKDKLIDLDTDIDKVAKTCDKISLSQEKIVNGQSKFVESQSRIVKLIDSVDRKINGRKE